MDENKLRGPTIKYFTEAMWTNENLKKISIAKCSLNLEAISKILEAFENNTGLEAVNLANNNITEKSADNLASLLASDTSRLKYLNLADNYLTDECLQKLEISRHLRALVLRNNSIKNEGAQQILHMLHHNENLRRVDLTKNMVSIKYLIEISKLLEKKREKRATNKLQQVRNEIVYLKQENSTIVQVQKETRKVISEKVIHPYPLIQPPNLGKTPEEILRRKVGKRQEDQRRK